jgi:hypothetical protein
MKIVLIPVVSLAVIGAAALLTTATHPMPTAPACVEIQPDVTDVPTIERHHFAKPPPGPAPAPPAPAPVA